MYAAKNEKHLLCVVKGGGKPSNPRSKGFFNFGKMICWNREYELGDEHNFSSSFEFWDSVRRDRDNMVILPLYLSKNGVSISISTQRGDEHVGYIYADCESIKRELRFVDAEYKMQIAQKLLEEETQIYDYYLRGESYDCHLYDGRKMMVVCENIVGDCDIIKKFLRIELDIEYDELIDDLIIVPETENEYVSKWISD